MSANPKPINRAPAPTTGQGLDFFRALEDWERRELLKLPADYFGDTQPVGDTTDVPSLHSGEGWGGDDADTEPYPPDLDTRKILPLGCDCGWDD
jgi:hypothetical protein